MIAAIYDERVTQQGTRRRGRPSKDAEPAPVDQVLAKALAAFAVHGYEGVSLRTLNRELGVSHNLLYQRFGSKENLWYAAADWGFGGLVDHLTQADDKDEEPLERFRRFVKTFVRFSARNPDLLRLVNIEAGQSSDRLTYLAETYIVPVMTRMAPVYAELVETGRIRDVALHTVYYLITNGGGAIFASNAMTNLLFATPQLSDEEAEQHAAAVADVIVDGLSLP
ncbi:TetR/AcrR family transcriptional regulator [Amycolatopsis japonica]